MTPPVYNLHLNDIILYCNTPESVACGELIMLRDRNKTHHSDWWGHPTLKASPDGTSIISLPCNVHNLTLMGECGAVSNRNDSKAVARLSYFALSKKNFTTNLPLKPFQRDGAEWLIRGDLRRVLAFTMGLGKTITSIAAIMSDQERYLPAIVMAPAHVKLNWADEWEKWGGDPKDVVVLFGRTPYPEQIENKKIIVLNHHILAGWHDTLMAISPKTLIIDEAHSFVNSKTKTYPLADKLARACGRRVLLLTATPLVNDLGDLWGLTGLISRDILGTKKNFEETFMPEEKAKARMFASRWKGGFEKASWKHVAMARLPKPIMEKRMNELGSMLREHVILRKSKEDVYDQMPDITETHLRLNIPRTTPEGKKFWDVEEECAMMIAEAKDDVLASDMMLPAFGRARSNAATAKLPDAIAWIENFLSETDPSEKLVVVGWSVKPLEELYNKFKKHSLLVNGNIDARKKKIANDRFDAEPNKRILFGNVKSIGTGINLVASRTMLFIELPLTSVDFEQCKGRIDRLSQKSKALAYYYMTIPGTVEENMVWKIIRKKEKITKALGL